MTIYERGDVILVPFPFSDQTATKKRPAVIISSNAHNDVYADVVIMASTSKIENTVRLGECLAND
ncbi:MAG TPA: type II toxin-antitoxin system PemK/MazF family toxin [Candidatus Brocadiales bacterium]|nr:type II toxin-antitoxin system PemK/MazF family toxin [Candidatus Brocadiales bacterium]